MSDIILKCTLTGYPSYKDIATSSLLIDRVEVELLANLEMPQELVLLLDVAREDLDTHVIVEQWQSKNTEAHRMVDYLGKAIAVKLARFIGNEIRKREGTRT